MGYEFEAVNVDVRYEIEGLALHKGNGVLIYVVIQQLHQNVQVHLYRRQFASVMRASEKHTSFVIVLMFVFAINAKFNQSDRVAFERVTHRFQSQYCRKLRLQLLQKGLYVIVRLVVVLELTAFKRKILTIGPWINLS